MEVAGTVKAKIDEELAEVPESVRKNLKIPKTICQALPSSSCPKGTRGRVGVFEVLSMTGELEKLILKGPTEPELLAEARRQGMITMREDGILKVLAGEVGLEELSEVI